MSRVTIPSGTVDCLNLVGGTWRPATSGRFNDVVSPYTGSTIGRVTLSSREDVATAVELAAKAQIAWGKTSLKDRSAVMFRFRNILLERIDSISHTIASESGKLFGEAKAGLMKGVEVLEFALGIQNFDFGGKMEVSSGVSCEFKREPLGVVAGVTPFNFPAMVPMWMIPIALTLGNSFVWKPSDKTPLTSRLIADALKDAGLPDGVFTIVQGEKEVVEALCDHPTVAAVGFVGSTPVAKSLYERCARAGKRVLALGGAKNHIILMPDAEPKIAVSGILASFTGCAGQRCMAASVLIAVGEVDSIIQQIANEAKRMSAGNDVGAIISKASRDKLVASITDAEKQGARLLADGRNAKAPAEFPNGFWLGPTILDNVQPTSSAACDEWFGPVLSIVRVPNLTEAMRIENQNPYGNAASVFTTQGAIAEYVAEHSKAGMIGVNVGVPVPREPFSFGGFFESKFGHGDMTGPSSLDFWSRQKKVTTKWTMPNTLNWMS